MFSNNTKFRIITNIILAIVMTICITVSAIYFSKISVLWFYLLPFVIAMIDDEPKHTKKE